MKPQALAAVELNKLEGASSRAFSATDLMARVFAPVRWAVIGLLIEGIIIFAGRPKLGKSWLAFNIAVAVASGGRALGSIPVEQGDVLYLALEDGERRLQDRLRTTLAGESVPKRLFLAVSWPRLDETGVLLLKQWLIDHPEARLIVIDTLKRVRPRERVNGRLYDLDYDAIQPIADLARQYGVAILVVHHTRKQDSEDPLDLVSGSNGLTGAADSVLVLKRARGQVDAVLHATGRDIEDKEIALTWDNAVTSWRVLGDAAEHKRSGQRREILEMLQIQQKPLSPKTISQLLGRDHSAIRKLLWTMAKDGDGVRADDRGNYSLIAKNDYSETYFPPGIDPDEILERRAIMEG